MNSSIITSALFIVLLAYSHASFSEALVEVGIHLGGDELIIEDYSNGAKNSAKAGNLFSFAIGGVKSFSDTIDGQLSIGIKSDIIKTDNPEVVWIRYPINAMLFYGRENYRVGLGLTAHLSPKLKGNGVASNISENYKDAIGGLFEIDFTIDTTFKWGLRFTNIKYDSKLRDRSVSGNSLGILMIALI